MISKETEQKSEVLKIVGFALLTPLGRIFVEPIVVLNEFGFIGLICYIIFGFTIGTFGLTCILRSCEILEEKRIKNKWIN